MNILKKLFSDKVKNSLLDYNEYFDNRTINNVPLDFFTLGQLNLVTDQIIACDPLVSLHNALPFKKHIKPGSYPVTVCIAKTENSGDRYAIVKIEFSKARAIKWEMALVGNQNIKDLKEEDEFFGFPVDAGLGCFSDLKTQKFFNEWSNDFEKNNPGANIYDDFLDKEFKKNAKDKTNPQDAGDWLDFKLPNKPDLNIIMFQSGYGDGVYPCYWGISDTGETCSLIVDFQIL